MDNTDISLPCDVDLSEVNIPGYDVYQHFRKIN